MDESLNFVKVRCFNSLTQSGLEDVVRARVLLALSNLQLRGQSTAPTPVVYAGDLTVFSTNPKEPHLQESLSQLRILVQVQVVGAKTLILLIFFNPSSTQLWFLFRVSGSWELLSSSRGETFTFNPVVWPELCHLCSSATTQPSFSNREKTRHKGKCQFMYMHFVYTHLPS